MSNAWTNAVVVDPRELQRLTDEIADLRTLRTRQRRGLGIAVAIAVTITVTLGVHSSRLSTKTDELSAELSAKSNEAQQFRKISKRANTALTALARSHDQILAATEKAPSVGTDSWGRRFTVTKYLPRSEAYGKDNDGLTATLRKADPAKRIVAVDPKLIPYGSQVWVEGLGWFDAQDCGGAIKGFRLDLLTATMEDAMAFGKQDRFVIVVPPTV